MMNTFETLKTLFSQDLHELQLHQKRWWHFMSMTRVVKEEHLGRCCYLAEEFLSPADLYTFKQTVGIDEHQWHAYKAKVSGP